MCESNKIRLKFSSHAVAKSNQMLGLIKRFVCSQEHSVSEITVFDSCLVRLHMECGALVNHVTAR